VIAYCTRNHCIALRSLSLATKNISATAPKESQKPAENAAQGSNSSTAASASASVRTGEAMRPDQSAIATTVTIQKVRCAGTAKPAISV